MAGKKLSCLSHSVQEQQMKSLIVLSVHTVDILTVETVTVQRSSVIGYDRSTVILIEYF
jgi:hypothetical protein